MQHLYDIDVRVPMRDGVALAANVWHPVEGKAPALLVRLPYGKDAMMGVGHALMPDLPALLEAGYALVVQDCRGTHRSEGEFVPHMADRHDGEDTVAWITEQPWSDGTVGMYGPSYLGMVQWETAVTGVPGLKAIAPSLTSIDNYEAPWYGPGGALSLSLVTMWNAMMYAADAQRSLALGVDTLSQLQELGQAVLSHEALNDVLPTAQVPVLAAYGEVVGRLDGPPVPRRVLGRHGAHARAQERRRPGAEHRRLVRPLHRADPAHLHHRPPEGRQRGGTRGAAADHRPLGPRPGRRRRISRPVLRPAGQCPVDGHDRPACEVLRPLAAR